MPNHAWLIHFCPEEFTSIRLPPDTVTLYTQRSRAGSAEVEAGEFDPERR